MFNWLKEKAVEPVVAPVGAVVEVVAPLVVAVPVKAGEYRLGMWVKTAEGVGIVVPDGAVLVKEDGSNKMTLDAGDKAVPHVVSEIERQAFLEEIPVSRRPDVNNVFGYVSAQ